MSCNKFFSYNEGKGEYALCLNKVQKSNFCSVITRHNLCDRKKIIYILFKIYNFMDTFNVLHPTNAF